MERRVQRGLYEPSTERANCGVGFIAQISGAPSHALVSDALRILVNLEHRGACGGDQKTGDGAGIMTQLPERFLRRAASEAGITIPAGAAFGAGNMILPRDKAGRERCKQIAAEVIAEEGAVLLGFRVLPVEKSVLPKAAEIPGLEQVFVGVEGAPVDAERSLFIIRRLIEKRITAELPGAKFHIPSLSCRRIVYKGLLLAPQIGRFFRDLTEPDFESALALVHQRYSTNTFPSWELAHPFRFLCHNGEINTLRGNLNWLRARESVLESPLFGEKLQRLFPIVPEGLSDSASLDAMLELLVHAGRSLPHAMCMLIPEAWEKRADMDPAKRAFYEYHSRLMEPWDGPALAAFSDGVRIGALLDRNGLRPARYLLTTDGRIVLASESGALEVPPADVVEKGRLAPGKMLLVDLEQQRIIPDSEIKEQLAGAAPYGEWLAEQTLPLPPALEKPRPELDRRSLFARQRAFGYTTEDLHTVIAAMANTGEEPIGSMGADIPLAVFSERPVLLYDYFKQLFAQVTNPPLDAIREEIVTSTYSLLGAEQNLLSETPAHARRIVLDRPVLEDSELARLKEQCGTGLKVITLSAVFPAEPGAGPREKGEALCHALDQLCELAEASVASGYSVLVLTDRPANERHAAIPALLACSAVHHHLIRAGRRSACSLVIESAEPREVHHIALLLGYGASAVVPYLALASMKTLQRRKRLRAELSLEDARANYLKALNKGVVKVMSKMGVSVLQSYCGAQIFEAVGIAGGVIERYFCGTSSRIGGLTLVEIAEEACRRHQQGFGTSPLANVFDLDVGGDYQWRRLGERHLNNPLTVAKLQHAVRSESFSTFQEYSSLVNEQNRRGNTLRGLVGFRPAKESIPLDEVEPAKEIVKRFKTGAMSFGSISFEAHANLALAMNRIGGKSNSGEGGEEDLRNDKAPDIEVLRERVGALSPWLAEQLQDGDSLRSAIRQIASARFGVTSSYLANAEEIQIKIAQGAKPGEGGQLPGHKVDRWIASVRHSTPGVALISPPPHHDIYSIEDLAQLVFDLKNANPEARVSVKLVSEVGVGTIAAGVAKAKADAILISGADGGTGASPLSSIKHAGLPWELGLAEAHQVLQMNGLREFVTLETDGQLKTGRDVAIACLLGAEEFGFSTAPMIAQGCVMMRKCHLNTCPVGIATQDPELRKKFSGKPEHVVNFMFFVAQELRVLMSKLGFRTVAEMVGRSERLSAVQAMEHWKARGVDLGPMLVQSRRAGGAGAGKRRQQHGIEKTLDAVTLLDLARPALAGEGRVYAELPIRNVNRAVGTLTGTGVTRAFGAEGLPEGSIHFKFSGSAGQSFGAFIPRGMLLEVEGDVNDYAGKGLSGGTVVVYPPKASTFNAAEQIIAGNVAFYGATGGKGFLCGKAGERFCVRNSGAEVVVEGVGDHGCEYMTGGRVLILGETGRNFGAGMSGGIAYVLGGVETVAPKCNLGMVELEAPDAGEISWIESMMRLHLELTGSPRASELLESGAAFVKVIPVEYKRALGLLSADEKFRVNVKR